MRLAQIVEASRRVSDTSARRDKIARLAAALRQAGREESRLAVAYLSGELPQGRIGIGPAALHAAWSESPARSPSLELLEVDRTLARIAAAAGAGSTARRAGLLRELLARATREEREFLARLLLGELRQGAQEGIMLDALAQVGGAPPAAVRRAVMFAGDVGEVAVALLARGPGALSGFSVRLFRPVKPMLAESAANVGDVLARFGEAAFEPKLDGARVQVHRDGDEVRLYTRRLNDETAALPELVRAVRSLPVRQVILDGEAIALRDDGRPHPFQTTMRRFGRKAEVGRLEALLPLTPFFFDCLLLEGEPLIDLPARERYEALARAVPAGMTVPRIVTRDPAEASRFVRAALDAGHEGVMGKDPAAPYVAGRRGRAWLKLKPSHTLDLVVLAAEWGHGRRKGWLSNLHLGARDEEGGGLAMVGKTFKGMTDEMLEWQTARLLRLQTERTARVVRVRPELVVEVAFDGVQRSPRYPGGIALRFARLKGYREDKSPAEADTLATLRALLER